MSTLTRHLSGAHDGTHEMVRTYSRRVEIPMLGEVAVGEALESA